jgi:hypothetical protein
MTEPEEAKKRRSSRAALEVRVLIRGNAQDGRLIQIQAFTSIVSAHGGLLESPLGFVKDQRIVLVNPHSKIEVSCRVVEVKGPSLAVYEVAFEFEHPTAKFWPIDIRPDDWSVVEKAAARKRAC